MKVDAGSREPPLVIDLDGSLLRTDLLIETFLQLLVKNPIAALHAFFGLFRGKACFKSRVANHVVVEIAGLPINEEVLSFIKAEKARGRPLYLASASHRRNVEIIAEHLSLFDGVFSTDVVNLSGSKKANTLVAAFGEKGFDYVGDHAVDVAVWDRARKVIAVAPNSGLVRKLRERYTDIETCGTRVATPSAYWRSLRPHQWIKNVLVFVPVAAAHALHPYAIAGAFVAFVAFCFAASSAYLLNDLLDLRNDREHLTKRERPLASGALPLKNGLLLVPALLLAAIIVAAAWSWDLVGIIALYYGTTVLYSTYLKRKLFIDVITLAGLYTLRVLAGWVATAVPSSPWLLMFSLFLFLCLAIVKRVSELVERGRQSYVLASGRGYYVDDIAILPAFGAAAGYTAALVVGLYISSDDVRRLYHHPDMLWFVCPLLLYWLSRMLIVARRGQMHEDPVIFTLTDRGGLIVAMLVLFIVVAAV